MDKVDENIRRWVSSYMPKAIKILKFILQFICIHSLACWTVVIVFEYYARQMFPQFSMPYAWIIFAPVLLPALLLLAIALYVFPIAERLAFWEATVLWVYYFKALFFWMLVWMVLLGTLRLVRGRVLFIKKA